MTWLRSITKLLDPAVIGALAVVAMLGTLSTCYQSGQANKARQALTDYKDAIEAASQKQKLTVADAAVNSLETLREKVDEDQPIADAVAERVMAECVQQPTRDPIPVPKTTGKPHDAAKAARDLRKAKRGITERDNALTDSRRWAAALGRDLKYCNEELHRFRVLQQFNDEVSEVKKPD